MKLFDIFHGIEDCPPTILSSNRYYYITLILQQIQSFRAYYFGRNRVFCFVRNTVDLFLKIQFNSVLYLFRRETTYTKQSKIIPRQTLGYKIWSKMVKIINIILIHSFETFFNVYKTYSQCKYKFVPFGPKFIQNISKFLVMGVPFFCIQYLFPIKYLQPFLKYSSYLCVGYFGQK